MFEDTFGNYMSPGTTLKPETIPTILSSAETATVQQITNAAGDILKSVVSVNTLLTILVAGPLQQLLDSVK